MDLTKMCCKHIVLDTKREIIFKLVKELCFAVLGTDAEDVTESALFNDLGMDDVDSVMFLLACYSTFQQGIDSSRFFPPENNDRSELWRYQTVGSYVDFLTKSLKLNDDKEYKAVSVDY